MTLAEALRLLGEVGGGAHVAGQVGKVAHQVGAVARGITMRETAPCRRATRRADRAKLETLQSRRRRSFAGLQVVDAIQRRVSSLDRRACEEIVVKFARCRTRQRDRRAFAAGASERADRRVQRLAPGLARDFRPTLTDQQHARGLEARKRRQQQGVAQPSGEVARLQKAAELAAAQPVERRCVGRQLAVVVDADDDAVGLDLGRSARENFELHDDLRQVADGRRGVLPCTTGRES